MESDLQSEYEVFRAAIDTAALAVEAELARRPQPAGILVSGTARELFAAALRAGLRITGPPGLLLLSNGEPPRALAPSGYASF
jgi:hypothetical protein